MTWDQTYRSRRRDRQKLFVVNYADGSRAFLRVPHEIAAFGVSPPVMKLVREVQARGEIPAGGITWLIAAWGSRYPLCQEVSRRLPPCFRRAPGEEGGAASLAYLSIIT